MRRNHIVLVLALFTNVLLYQNCGPVPLNHTTIYQSEQGSLGDPSAQSLGQKMLAYESDGGTPAPGVDAIDKKLTWYATGQVVESTIRRSVSGQTQTDVVVATVMVDTVTLRGRIQVLPAATTFTLVPGSSVACGSGNKRYLGYRRDGSSVLMYEERDCTGAFTSEAFDQVLFDKIMAIRNIAQ